MQAGATMDDLAISIALPSEEAALVAELQSGSEQAFAQLIDRYHQPLYSLIARSLQDPADAADITQEVFLKVFRNIRGFHGESSLRTWLYRIALREASNQRRWWSRHKRREIDLDAPSSSRCASDSAAGAHSLGSTLADAGSLALRPGRPARGPRARRSRTPPGSAGIPRRGRAARDRRPRLRGDRRPPPRQPGHGQVAADAWPRRTARRAHPRAQTARGPPSLTAPRIPLRRRSG